MPVTITLSDATANELLNALTASQPTPTPPPPPTPTPPPPPPPTPTPPSGADNAIPWSTQRIVVQARGGETHTLTLDTPNQILLTPGVISASEYGSQYVQREIKVKDGAGNVLLHLGPSINVQVGGTAPDIYTVALPPGSRSYIEVLSYGDPSKDATFGIGWGALPRVQG